MDLKEAISSLIYASPRCADLPELIQIRTLFTAKYGKEFVASATELRPDCGVNRRVRSRNSSLLLSTNNNCSDIVLDSHLQHLLEIAKCKMNIFLTWYVSHQKQIVIIRLFYVNVGKFF